MAGPRQRLSVRSAPIIGLLAILGIAGCSNRSGEEFQDVAAIGMSPTWNDWVIVGRLGPNGPAGSPISRSAATAGRAASHGGRARTDDGFQGCSLTVLRLESPAGDVSHVV